MDSSVLRRTGCRAVVALLGLIAGMGTMQAANVLTTVSGSTAVALTCSATNPTATVSIKAVTANAAVSGIGLVTPLPSSITVAEVGSGTALSSTITSLSFTVSLASPGSNCANLPPSVTFNFKTTTTPTDLQITVNFTNLGNQLRSTPTAVNVTCDPSGSSSVTATATIKPVMTLVSNSIVVSATGATGSLQVTGVGTLNASNQSTGLTVTFGFGSGCSGLGTSQTITFMAGGTADVQVTVNITTLGINVTPSSITLSCTKNSDNTYSIVGSPQTISVTSVGGGSYPYTVTNPTWVTTNPASVSATASSSATTFTVTPTVGCNALSGGSSSTGTVTIVATGASALNKTIPVTLNVLSATPLVINPASPSLSYVKGSGSPGKIAVTVTAPGVSPAPYFAVNTATMPAWLTVDTIGGIAPKTLTFSSTSIADSLAPGTYTARIGLSISGYTDYKFNISLLITNSAPTLSLSPAATTIAKNWTVGSALPTVNLNVVSSDTPIPYTITTGGPLAPVVAQPSGLAYNFGTQIPVTFNSSVFSSAQPGNTLTGTVSIVWGQPASTTVVTINVTVLSAAASLSSVAPVGLPTATSGTFTLSFSGTGFVAGTGSGSTKLGIVSGQSLVFDPYVVATVTNTGITAVITVPPGGNDSLLPFSTATSGTVTFGVCNPIPPASTCNTPSGGTQQVTISSGPILSALTSASSFVQSSTPTVAPYDMVSIFGANFCPVCSSNTVMYGTLDPASLRYGTALLSPDNTNSISVSLYPHGAAPTSGNLIANAPLLFATNSQINALIPAAINPTAQAGGVDVYVNWGPNPPTAATKSNLVGFALAVASSDPGIFTVGEDGQGPGAILSQNWSVISSANPAAMRHTTSDTVSLWMTGLGAPDSNGDNTTAGTNGGWVYPTDCVTMASYQTSLDTYEGISTSTSLDGAILQTAALNTNRQVPCFGSSDMSVTIGGAAASVTYAGWTPTSVAGLYQIDIQLPNTTATLTDVNGNQVTSFTAPMQLPVVVTVGSGGSAPASQNGVTIWVAPRLQVNPPTVLTGTVGVQYGIGASGTNNCTSTACEIVASDSTTSGTASYKYAITSGALPAGLSLTSSGSDPNAIVTITGTPAANTAGTYQVTVTATDTSMSPALTGSTTFTITIAGGLYVTGNGISNSLKSGTAGNVVLVAPSGGVAPYTYAIASTINGQTLPSTVSVSASGQVAITAQMPAGTYPVAVTVTDSNGLTGTYAFTFDVALNLTKSSINSVTAASGGVITTATTTGQTGTITYSVTAIDNSNSGAAFAGVSMSGGNLTVDTTGVATHSYTATITATDSGTAAGSSAPAVTTTTVNFTLN